MTSLLWFVAGAVLATGAIFFVLAIVTDDELLAEDAYEEGMDAD